jgi:hypothetical protein
LELRLVAAWPGCGSNNQIWSCLGLPRTVGTSIAQGRYLNAATAREPAVVLGAAAAQLLGIDRIWPGERIGSTR